MKTSLLRLIITVIATFSLFGCFGQASKPTGEVVDNRFVSEDFSIPIPLDWEVITQFPENLQGNAIVSIRNHVKDSDFVANVNVAYTPVKNDVDIRAFANQLLQTHKDTLVEFRHISTRKVEIDVADAKGKTLVNVFQGKPSAELGTLQISQLYAYKGQRIYIVTGMYQLDDEQFAKEKVENMLKFFKIL